MRYAEVVRQYLSVREASSREWAISESLVMCVELDTSADAYITLGVAASSSQQRKAPQFLRLTLFRTQPPMIPWMVDVETVDLSDAERSTIADHQAVLVEWVSGRRDRLPPSTSSSISDRLQQKR